MFVVSDAEWERTAGLPHLAFRVYVSLRRRMDYRTGRVGESRTVTYAQLLDDCAVDVKTGPRYELPTVPLIRTALRQLADRELISPVEVPRRLVFDLPHATKKSSRNSADQQSREQSRPPGEKIVEIATGSEGDDNKLSREQSRPNAEKSSRHISSIKKSKNRAAPACAREGGSNWSKLLTPLSRDFHANALTGYRLTSAAARCLSSGVTPETVETALGIAKKRCRGIPRTPDYVIPIVDQLHADAGRHHEQTTQSKPHADFAAHRYAGDGTTDADLPAFLKG